MEETIAQAAPNNGASNAADFQPPTQSPQTAPGSLQQQNGIQSSQNPQEFLNQNQNAQIKVIAQPAPAPAQVKSDVTSLIIIALIAIPLALLLYKLSNKFPSSKTNKKAQTEEVPTEQPESSPEEPEAPPSNSKQPKAKSKSKKSKRRNR